MSLLLYAVFILYTVQKGKILAGNLDPSIQLSETLRSMDDLSTISPRELGFDFAFTLKKNLDPNYAYFEAKQVREYYLSNGTKVNETRNLTVEKCDIQKFKFDNKTLLKSIGLDKLYYCINSQEEYEVGGNQISVENTYLQIKLMKCSAGSSIVSTYPKSLLNLRRNLQVPIPTIPVSIPTLPVISPIIYEQLKCGTLSTFNQVINNQVFNMLFVNNYFAAQETESHIRQFLDDSLYIEMETNKNKKADLYIMKNSANVLEDIWQAQTPTEYEYAEVQNIRFYEAATQSGDNSILTVNIKLDKQENNYEKRSYSVLAFLGDIGGLQGILYLLGLYVVSTYAEHSYFRTIMRETIQIQDHKFKNKEQEISLRQSQKNLNKSQKDIENCGKSSTGQSSQDGSQLSQQIKSKSLGLSIFGSNQASAKSISGAELNKDDVLRTLRKDKNPFRCYYDAIVEIIALRFKFNYKYLLLLVLGFKGELVVNSFACCCKRTKTKLKLIEESEKHIQKELCVTNILKSLRRIQLLEQLLLNKQQRTLLKYQKEWLVDAESDDDSNDDQFGTSSIQQSQNNLSNSKGKSSKSKTKRKDNASLDNPSNSNDKPLRKIVKTQLKRAYLKDHFTLFTKRRKLNQIDKRLLHGLVSRKVEDYERLDTSFSDDNNSIVEENQIQIQQLNNNDFNQDINQREEESPFHQSEDKKCDKSLGQTPIVISKEISVDLENDKAKIQNYVQKQKSQNMSINNEDILQNKLQLLENNDEVNSNTQRYSNNSDNNLSDYANDVGINEDGPNQAGKILQNSNLKIHQIGFGTQIN
eukprot:403339910